jgi:hypothetical protein
MAVLSTADLSRTDVMLMSELPAPKVMKIFFIGISG